MVIPTQTKQFMTKLFLTVVLLLILPLAGCSQTRPFWARWSYYPESGSPDACKLRLYEVDNDSVIVKTWSDSINIQWTSHRFTINDDGFVHLFVMTAVDTAGNESQRSNVAKLDLKRPSPVLDFTVHEDKGR